MFGLRKAQFRDVRVTLQPLYFRDELRKSDCESRKCQDSWDYYRSKPLTKLSAANWIFCFLILHWFIWKLQSLRGLYQLLLSYCYFQSGIRRNVYGTDGISTWLTPFLFSPFIPYLISLVSVVLYSKLSDASYLSQNSANPKQQYNCVGRTHQCFHHVIGLSTTL